jgi:hypothetical protein
MGLSFAANDPIQNAKKLFFPAEQKPDAEADALPKRRFAGTVVMSRSRLHVVSVINTHLQTMPQGNRRTQQKISGFFVYLTALTGFTGCRSSESCSSGLKILQFGNVHHKILRRAKKNRLSAVFWRRRRDCHFTLFRCFAAQSLASRQTPSGVLIPF